MYLVNSKVKTFPSSYSYENMQVFVRVAGHRTYVYSPELFMEIPQGWNQSPGVVPFLSRHLKHSRR
jgi:hypothetical protein